MNDFLVGRPVYRPLNGFSDAIREEVKSSCFPSMMDQVVTRSSRTPSPLGEEVCAVSPAAATSCGGKPELELIQTEGKIEQIIVTCPCGERITLHCSY